MYVLRRWQIIFTAWIFLFFGIERLYWSVDIEWSSYTFIAAVALATLIVPFLRRLSLRVLMPSVVSLFLIIKLAHVRAIWGTALPLTVTELSAIVLTVLLVRRLNRALDEFHGAVAAIAISHAGEPMSLFSISQGEMYREVQRARRHNRPLTLLALKIEQESCKVALDQMIKEVQEAMIDQLMLIRVAGVLNDELHDYDIIALQDTHFLVLLPEVEEENLPGIVNRLRHAVSEQIGFELQVGTAVFPDNAVTFDGLLEQALQGIEARPSSLLSVTVAHSQASLQEL